MGLSRLLSLFVLFLHCFRFFFLGGGRALIFVAAGPILLFFTPYPNYTCFSLSKLPKVCITFFFGRFSKPEISQRNPGYLRPTINALY